MWTKGSGTSSVKPPVLACSARMRNRCRAQCCGRSTWPNMIVAVLRRPSACARSHDLEPLAGRDLVRADHAADLVVQDLGGRAGQRAEPRALELRQERRRARRQASVHPARPRAARTHGRGSRVLPPSRSGRSRGRSRRCSRMDAALQAHLGRAALPRPRGCAARSPRDPDRRPGRAGSPRACPWRRRRRRQRK